ncbi:NAD(P)H-binding protein [Pelagibacterium flavum]|uniref:NAD(P)H-binding protein n=1 Tax=Pelagibacterium flavum TaxID=2984530 RepID=A0ABY6ITR2_9HYPH|nr:NAD(P)H-binding protein [Pelagibacterium sp. YIM 151497]MAN77972.1 NmrA family transcriptional regulator [Hyphomicrobiales bacterium]UYQ74012.1 NAD(P)H-binding protein [Pelagibacterium sp. YIM 151497]|tara:strand:+ start:2227 stop:3057 length:831 start_codon:yes stop_codon:yes gene_type:complete
MTFDNPILVIGATGKIGSRVASRMAALDHAHRAVSRSTNPAFNWEDPATWADAMRGMRSAFVTYVPDLAAPGAPEVVEHLAAVARAEGLRKIVLLSGRGERGAELSEDRLSRSGLDYAVVRASWFNQNFDEGMLLPSILSGTLALAAGDKLEPFVDADDIADVAVAALLDDRHNGHTYDVTGPRLMTFADAASEIAAAAGRAVNYVPLSIEDFHAALLAEMGRAEADLLTSICAEVFDGRNEWVGDGVQKALGREPRDFADYVRNAIAKGAWRQAA